MNRELGILYFAAAAIGFLHTVFGPDHYLPFIVMSRARKWSMPKTAVITFLCGLGHIVSSVILGMIGIVFGVAIMKVEAIESFRGNLAAWALIVFGFSYFVWGIRRALGRNRIHKHAHVHSEISEHEHDHAHGGEHVHVHDTKKGNITPWILFTIFILGPCEPLIPMLMYPAAKNSLVGLIGVTLTFAFVTVVTMLGIVLVSSFGINLLPLNRLERYSHALAGMIIFVSGIAVQCFGL